MATYLLTWNPKRWQWDDLQDDIDKINKKGSMLGTWSAAGSKSIRRGDRLFLLRQGTEPRGIVGSGWAASDVFEGPHWDEEKRKAGKSTRHVKVRFDHLLNPDSEAILSRQELDGLGNMHWDSQSSGISIPDAVAERLENLWANFLKTDRFLPDVTAEPAAIEGLKTEITVYVRGRSRELREIALEKANGVCCVCDMDFKKLLDGKGVRALHVHHRKQLAASDAPIVTRLSDLAVVCANCHSLIHMNPRKAIEIERLRAMLVASIKK